jgi:hypothetical protein
MDGCVFLTFDLIRELHIIDAAGINGKNSWFLCMPHPGRGRAEMNSYIVVSVCQNATN